MIRKHWEEIAKDINKEPEPWPADKLRVKVVYDDGAYTLEILNPPSRQAEQILMQVLPKVLVLFLEKNKDYGDSMAAMRLGPKAQFVDIWRKVGKLRKSLWDGEPLVGEQSDEIIMDLIGHCLLALLDFQNGIG